MVTVPDATWGVVTGEPLLRNARLRTPTGSKRYHPFPISTTFRCCSHLLLVSCLARVSRAHHAYLHRSSIQFGRIDVDFDPGFRGLSVTLRSGLSVAASCTTWMYGVQSCNVGMQNQHKLVIAGRTRTALAAVRTRVSDNSVVTCDGGRHLVTSGNCRVLCAKRRDFARKVWSGWASGMLMCACVDPRSRLRSWNSAPRGRGAFWVNRCWRSALARSFRVVARAAR